MAALPRPITSALCRVRFARLPRGEALGFDSVHLGLVGCCHDVRIWTWDHECLVAIICPPHPIGRHTGGGAHRQDLSPPSMVADIAALHHEPIACACITASSDRAKRRSRVAHMVSGQDARPTRTIGRTSTDNCPSSWRRPRQRNTPCFSAPAGTDDGRGTDQTLDAKRLTLMSGKPGEEAQCGVSRRFAACLSGLVRVGLGETAVRFTSGRRCGVAR